MRFLSTITLSAMISAVGCGTTRKADVSTEDTCLYEGEQRQVGETFAAEDGCNTCTCSAEGVNCTAMSCIENNNVVDDKTCTYEGEVYKIGDDFPSIDDCNTCSCNPDGSVTCTAMRCDVCPEGDGWLINAGADYIIPSESCPCASPTEGEPCSEEGAECTYQLIHCEWQWAGYDYENSLYECVDGKWADQGQDCYDCCKPRLAIPCGDESCDVQQYCLNLGCGTPGCSAPPPRCEPLPSDCFDCNCLTKALNDATTGFADICSGTVPAVCTNDYPGLYVDCPGV